MWIEMYTASEGSLVTEAMERYNSFFLKMLLLIEQYTSESSMNLPKYDPS